MQMELSCCQWDRNLFRGTFLYLRQIVEWRGMEQGKTGKQNDY